ncbi:Protein export cytoplasm protein SecA ATPase RNA helicase [Rhodovulum sp. P5]|uniref:GNAT family N-acetyltransferase n=1 Tax=Rhodovulum sp. P5 TaxID=1564506 RepID=UPI0009C24E43|nr:GNAT family N-acetyltransferase [Rhodovulum sp. P5]ARE41108.1 Protein export cytoplasm protein SecA ATPase RNA helicase [Rhodovulum sp. P5]
MPLSAIPVIETQRLILRGPEAEDYPKFESTFTSYRARFMGGPLSEYESWMLYAAEIGHWQIHGFGMWMIHDRDTDATYGMAGGWFPKGWPEREIGWVIWPHAEGRGIALEAVHAVRHWCYETLGWETAVTYVDPKNISSVRLCERLGAKEDVAADTVDSHDIVYRHPSPAQLNGTQLADGIALEIGHYIDPLFKTKGVPLD